MSPPYHRSTGRNLGESYYHQLKFPHSSPPPNPTEYDSSRYWRLLKAQTAASARQFRHILVPHFLLVGTWVNSNRLVKTSLPLLSSSREALEVKWISVEVSENHESWAFCCVGSRTFSTYITVVSNISGLGWWFTDVSESVSSRWITPFPNQTTLFLASYLACLWGMSALPFHCPYFTPVAFFTNSNES